MSREVLQGYFYQFLMSFPNHPGTSRPPSTSPHQHDPKGTLVGPPRSGASEGPSSHGHWGHAERGRPGRAASSDGGPSVPHGVLPAGQRQGHFQRGKSPPENVEGDAASTGNHHTSGIPLAVTSPVSVLSGVYVMYPPHYWNQFNALFEQCQTVLFT